MGLVLIKERRILFSEFALSKSQYLYNNSQYLARSLFFFRPLLKLLILQTEERNSLIDKALGFLRQAPNQTEAHRVGWGPNIRSIYEYV